MSIAALRGITLGKLPTICLMMCINLVALMVSTFLVYRIIQTGGASDELAALGALMFGLWPFVGLVFTIYPIADIPAMCLLLAGLYLLQRSHRRSAGLLFGLALITHKVMWLFVVLLILVDMFDRHEFISKRNCIFIGITLSPVMILWVSGSVYHHSATWLISGNLQSELLSKSGALTIVDGILGTLIHGGTKGLLKGVLLLGSALATLAVLYASIKLRYEYFHYGLAISLAILILVVVLNQHGIWAAMRFDRLLAIPIAWIANTSSGLNQIKWWRPPAILILLSGLFLSQFTYAWYMARIYFG